MSLFLAIASIVISLVSITFSIRTFLVLREQEQIYRRLRGD